MRNKIIPIALILILTTSISFSQMLGPRFGFPPDDNIWQRRITQLYDELKLTDEQKTKIQNLFFEFRKNQTDITGKLNKARIELQELLLAEKLDKSAIDKKVDEISSYMKELTKNRTNHWMNIQQVLTPEQRKILREKSVYPGVGMGFRGWSKPGRGLKLRLHCW